MFSTRAALLLVFALPLVSSAQRVERFSLSGNRVALYNIAGKVSIESGSGPAVVVEVTRGGADAGQLKLEVRTIDGRSALCIVYPNERIIYRPSGSRFGRFGFSTSTSSDRDCQGGRTSGWLGLGGRRIEVRSSGDGVEAWADIRILVPAGRDVSVWNVVGEVDASNVDAALNIDVSAASVTTRRTRGNLNIDTGSGSVSVATHTGDLTIDVGSGSVQLDGIDAKTINVDTGSGSLRGNGVTADEFVLDTGSGSVDFGGVTARRVRVDTGSGSARMSFFANVESLEIDTGSGGVTLTLPDNFGAEVDISTGSGGITSDFVVGGGRSRNRNELHGTIGNGRGRVTIETGSGGVRLVRGAAEGARRSE